MDTRNNRLKFSFAGKVCATLCLFLLIAFAAQPHALTAQTGGEGAMQGTVTDTTGAVVPNAKVTATNTASGVTTVRTASGAGVFLISPLPPGPYTLTVEAQGFQRYVQTSLSVDALATLGVNASLTNGADTETVTVTSAPPVLDTTNATVGLVMENTTYANLPLQMNNAQRDATAFASLAPGAQAGARVPIVGGTGNYLGQLYVDGMPAETINQQGDNRLVSEGIDLDAVDQFQVVTSTPPAEYSGAGALNFTMKSGGNKFHGQVSDFVRNTIFDAWAFTAKAVQSQGLNPATGLAYPTCSFGAVTVGATTYAPRAGCQAKPVEHQNELSVSVGGYVPHTAQKVFFFFAYDKYHSRRGASYSNFTIPSTLMEMGDFTELNGNVGMGGYTGIAGDPSAGGANKALIFDPTSNSCVGTVCTRTPFQGVKNGLPTYNVIPTSYLSPISLKMASYMPAPSNPTVLSGNYLGGVPSGFDNNVQDYRVDYDVSAKQRISTIGAIGAVHYLNNYVTGGSGAGAYGLLPLPYTAGTIANIFPKVFDVEDTYSISDKLVNQLKYGFTRFIQPQTAATDGQSQYNPSAFGITNVPGGQAGSEFPGVSFGQTGAVSTTLTAWTEQGPAGSTQKVVPDTYTVLDNLQYLRGRHAITVGFTYQWQQDTVAAPVGPTGLVELPFNSNTTAQFANNSTSLSPTSGNSFASFLLGAVGGSPSLSLQPVSELGGRYHVAAPYVEDNWKVTNKLTVDIGLRYDYFPPYHEVKDRWSFLNPTMTNSATGNAGELQFAGNYGGAGVSCGCRTPVQTFWKNFGPRVGVVFAPDAKTVFRFGAARVFSQAGGVGGRGGAYQGTGQTGFNVTANAAPEVTTGMSAGPSFYLNNGATFTAKGIANTDLYGKGFAYPATPTPNAAAQTLQTGNYLNAAGGLVTAGAVSYADAYISGRAPEFTFFNVGIERSITKDMTISVNYVGDQAHFLGTGANVRGYYANQLNPVYLAALGGVTDTTGKLPILIAAATSANVAKAQGVMAGISIPTFYQTAANANPNSSTLTVAQGLVAFPQYSGVTDLWGQNSGNLTYHSLQIVLLQRTAHGASFNINYTYSKNIGDDGTFRSGFAIPAAALSGGGQNWNQDRIDRSWTGQAQPSVVHAFGVYELPFGKGRLGGAHLITRTLIGGFQLSGIYTYGSGTPVAVTSSACTSLTFPLQGQCMPDLTPGYNNARIGGSYGTSPNGTTFANLTAKTKYVDGSAFRLPQAQTAAGQLTYLIGNAPRTRPLNLNNPGSQNLDASLHRTFPIREGVSLMLEADCLNVWNKVQFGGPNGVWSTSYATTSFGSISSVSNLPRDFQFAGHFNF